MTKNFSLVSHQLFALEKCVELHSCLELILKQYDRVKLDLPQCWFNFPTYNAWLLSNDLSLLILSSRGHLFSLLLSHWIRKRFGRTQFRLFQRNIFFVRPATPIPQIIQNLTPRLAFIHFRSNFLLKFDEISRKNHSNFPLTIILASVKVTNYFL